MLVVGWLSYVVMVSTEEQEWAKDGNSMIAMTQEVPENNQMQSEPLKLPIEMDKNQQEICAQEMTKETFEKTL